MITDACALIDFFGELHAADLVAKLGKRAVLSANFRLLSLARMVADHLLNLGLQFSLKILVPFGQSLNLILGVLEMDFLALDGLISDLNDFLGFSEIVADCGMILLELMQLLQIQVLFLKLLVQHEYFLDLLI